MLDPRMEKLAETLASYSIKVQPGDNVMLSAASIPSEMLEAVVKAISRRGGNAYVETLDNRVLRCLYNNASIESFKLEAERDLEFMKKMQGYIGLRGSENAYEFSDVPADRMQQIRKIRRPVIDQRVKHTKWCVLRWATPSMAQSANMSTEAFENFYFDVCTLDYSKMKTASMKLVDLMNKTDFVQIVGPGKTNITFSIKDIPAISCSGEMNIPDGEVYTAPIKDSVNGTIHFNTPTVYDGIRFEDITLTFKNGKIVEATASDTAALNAILDTDDGSRFIGEFALGFNPYITKPMCDILFDEKIAGSIHFTPGACYDDASNGNKSNIHWDMVMIQTPEYGGGYISFDGIRIRDNGRFVHPDLLDLNPENLK